MPVSMPLPIRLFPTLLLVALGGCSVGSSGSGPAPAPTLGGDLGAITRARADSIRYPYTAADVHFMSGMIGHHAQAVAMAAWAPTRAASPAVKTLAERIVNGQQDEIATMQQWLRDRGQRVPEARASGTMLMTMNGVEHEMQMPGTLSEAQLQRLDQARGTEFDRLFLTFMIQHHRGAVAMVDELFGSQGAAQDEGVFTLASDVGVDQKTEIARMQQMLLELAFGDEAP